MTSHPTLIRICDEYGAALKESGYEEAATWSYGWDRTANGLKIDRIARGLFRDGVETGRFKESIFTDAGAEKFKDYLTETVAGHGDAEIGRYAAVLWESRPDLREAYPDLNGPAASGFLEWLHVFGPETGVSQELLTPGSTRHDAAPIAGPAPVSEPSEAALAPGVNVVGYISSERGVGEVARQVLAALRLRQIPAAEIDAPTDPAEIETALAGLPSREHPYDYNLICVNADMLPAVAAGLGPRFFDGRRTAGLWFWEVSAFPEYWLRSFDDVDEVWVATRHIAEALRPLTDKPVRTVRVPVTPGPAAEMTRAELGMPEGFTFLFVFDYRSVFRRKNPLGLVHAFKEAFPAGEGPSLVIKSICGDEFPADRAQLVEAVADRPEIHLIEKTVSAEAKNAMIASCDCYVSLHRSEGLGLTMAEAMYFGKPVIATAYSGNLDFMTAENSFLVPYAEVEIGADADPYPPKGKWAEPDLEFVSRTMREIVADPAEADRRGRRATIDIRHTHSPEASAASIEARIAEGRIDQLANRLHFPNASGSVQLDRLVGLGGPPVDRDSRQVRAAAKRTYVRLLRPYISYQNEVNASASRALDELRDRLVDVLSVNEQLNSRVSELERQLIEQSLALHRIEDEREGVDGA